MLEHHRRMFRYDHWANGECLASLRAAGGAPGGNAGATAARPAGGPPPKSLELFAHVLSAEWLWLERMSQVRQRFEVWPAWSLDECAAQLASLRPAWEELLAALDPRVLARRVPYTNTKGERFESAVGDILTHVVIHSAYHRGQIATDLRAMGHAPAYTDYIHAVRQGHVA